ncbi:3-epi-6-deoxocathasterone 23-monooxygenase CYP90C1 [Neltuma alba]|uniref:3-epi-6-deoxocathasterone 23-monooxygenase CYP90C1 n=1 Tax=Neltuma alba TaxID=207710 RepID=UPI0010A347CB|nr:3-epi-6-deoxocathasterone 23-monooxygenase CYP90C1 [Prosopis alba]XP_028807243.1 3-epi-6-deoxocathasterone 23-monooxygenase CYP90C1 [Prosopis alba]XP_028807244.1 3-epi-6-deoxocathasterone 23-monooxygenase CYP90C1 [Prosopis alba]
MLLSWTLTLPSYAIQWLIPPLFAAMLLFCLLRLPPKASRSTMSPPGTSGWPLLGETLHFLASAYTSGPLSFMDRRSSLYGRVFKTNILGSEVIVSADAEVNNMILQNQGNVFVPAYPKSIRELMGQHSILQMNGNLHRKLHSLIAGFLRSPLLKSRIAADIQRSVTHCLASWNHHPFIYVQDEVKKITFTILVRVLMSIGPGEELEALKRDFEEFIKGLICMPIKFPGTRLYKSLKAKERMMKTVRKIVEERKTATEEKGAARDAVDVLLGDNGLSVEAISGNIIEMMIPGEETLPTAMTMAVKFLSDSPRALSSLREENMQLKRQKTDGGDDYEWTDYMSLPFTQHVISETLRLANIVNAIWRRATKDVEIKGYIIPKGNCVVASLMSVHMDGTIYEKPLEFNPWRWEEQRMEGSGGNSKKGWYSPFGGGQRLCPGLEVSRLELSIFLHHLVTTYTWHAHPDHILYFPTVKMSRKLPLTVRPL